MNSYKISESRHYTKKLSVAFHSATACYLVNLQARFSKAEN